MIIDPLVRELNRIQPQKKSQCPTCGSREARNRHMDAFQEAFVRYLRENRTIRMDSCIACVEKHLSRAAGYYSELLTASGSGRPDGTASVDAYRAYLRCLQHLGLAIEESDSYEELNRVLLAAERQLRYEGSEPPWRTIEEEMFKIKNGATK